MHRMLSLAFGMLAAGAAMAQAPFPGRAVTMVVGFAPGGGTDTASRIIAKKLAENLGQSVSVENKPWAVWALRLWFTTWPRPCLPLWSG